MWGEYVFVLLYNYDDFCKHDRQFLKIEPRLMLFLILVKKTLFFQKIPPWYKV